MSADPHRFAGRLSALEVERDELLRRLDRASRLESPLWPVERHNATRRRLREVHTLIAGVRRLVEFEERYGRDVTSQS